jgi:RNA polymerase sigma-70 factor (ECF subfamily)
MLAMGPTNAEGGGDRSAPEARAGEPASTPGSSASAARHVDDASIPPQPDPARKPIDFAAEYQRAYRVLWVVAAGVLGRSAGAEDVVQEAALLALGKLDQFQPGTHFAAWMAQMVRYVALNQVRRQVRGRAQSLDDADGGGAHAHLGAREPELRLGSRGELPQGQHNFDDRLMRALEGLTEVARGCLLLRTLEGMEYEEIGRVFDIPQGTAMSHVHRSRMRLRQRLMHADPAGGAWKRDRDDDEERRAES